MVVEGNPIRVLLADGHALCRDGLTRILETEPEIHVIGAANNGPETIALAGTHGPSVVIMALDLSDDDLEKVVGLIRTRAPKSKILILSTHDDPVSVRRALKAGAHGYVTKDLSGADLVAAIRATERNSKRAVVSVSLDSLTRYGEESTDPLTPREAEVLGLAAEALTNVQIASRLGIAESTVKRHLTNAYARLSAASRIDAINKAMAGGIIRVPTVDR
jgi:DNA-binding NarL/FixJ family response regulator